ncbi:MAG: hypothetical protein LBG64_02605, partial [Pseudomonadales bacterium]|nr:hypothetical protein [Pseudomonadales bacterium]
MAKIMVALLRTARPLQWLKNFVLFAPLIFSGALFDVSRQGVPYALIAFQAFLLFCVLTSSTYFINDILDAKKD